MTDYEAPRIVASYDADELRRDAAVGTVYVSDAELKEEIRRVDESRARLAGIKQD